uniref:Uncharacterized protein n=1 Tax=Arion vulgaris TaxID=1028688 RepID=A0A0B7BE92_9EUPU
MRLESLDIEFVYISHINWAIQFGCIFIYLFCFQGNSTGTSVINTVLPGQNNSNMTLKQMYGIFGTVVKPVTQLPGDLCMRTHSGRLLICCSTKSHY